MTSALKSAPAERNKQPILEVLERVLPRTGVVLEIASGTGQHVVHFARAMPALTWQPSDPDAAMRESIAAHISASGLDNVLAPVALDSRDQPWPCDRAQAIVCINMIHIAPWPAAEGLMHGAAGLLAAGAPLVLYGPFRQGGRHTAPSNEAFDDSLRQRDPDWGVRDLDDVTALARQHGFEPGPVVSMPANNLTVTFIRDIGRPA